MCDFAARNLFCTYVLCTYSCDAYEYIFHHLLTSITERRYEVINYEVEYCRLIICHLPTFITGGCPVIYVEI